MKKSEILIFSISGVLLALTSFVKNFLVSKSFALGTPFDGKSIPDGVYNQIKSLNSYQIIAGRVYYALFVVFLLYIGWKIAYGFLELRYIISISFIILLIPALIEFAFFPNDRSMWLFLCQDIIHAAAWIGIMKIYYITSKKVQIKKDKEIL